MPKRSRLSIAKPKIEKFFNNLPIGVFTRDDLKKIFFEYKIKWGLYNTSLKKFIEYLTTKSNLEKVILDFSLPITRYIWKKENKKPNIYELCNDLKPGSYFSHYTAMYFNNLTEQIPKTIYVNYEQSKKNNKKVELLQENIDKAFRKKVRQSNNFVRYNDYKIVLLNGKYTGRIGVISFKLQESDTEIEMTNLERTLIDATVRPVYCGGVFEVLKAYKNALDYISVNKLNAYLAKINYIYPYHQAVGFYLERAGCSDKRLNILDCKKEFDFYLAHNMKEISYDKKWRIYYPKMLDD